MARSNPRATAVQAALQGFSQTFFPVAQQQHALEQELTLKTALQQQELSNALQLAQEKNALEMEQRRSALEQALSMGGDQLEVSGIGAEGYPTFKRKEPTLTEEEITSTYGLSPEEARPLARLPAGEARQAVSEIRRGKAEKERLKLTREGLEQRELATNSLIDFRKEQDVNKKTALFNTAEKAYKAAMDKYTIMDRAGAAVGLPSSEAEKLQIEELGRNVERARGELDKASSVRNGGATKPSGAPAAGGSFAEKIKAERERRAKGGK